MGKPWTEAEVSTLRELAALKRSASQIGSSINKSKGAVAGKALRLGIQLHGVGGNPVGYRYKPRIVRERISEPTPLAVNLMDRRPHQCCWPLWGQDAKFEEMFYCGAPADRNYCPYHLDIMMPQQP